MRSRRQVIRAPDERRNHCCWQQLRHNGPLEGPRAAGRPAALRQLNICPGNAARTLPLPLVGPAVSQLSSRLQVDWRRARHMALGSSSGSGSGS